VVPAPRAQGDGGSSGVKKKRVEETTKLGVLHVDASCSSEPLRVCVRNAVANYFQQLDGHPTTGLHQFVLAEVEVPLLEAVLEHTGGNQSRASEILGINRGTLRKKLKDYDLS
jgi:Fis family transcriptional regulator